MTAKPTPRRKQDRQYWDEMAARWEDEIFNSLESDKSGVIASEIERSSRRGRSVADLGCGTGVYLPFLSRKFDTVHGFERSQACVAIARKNLKSRVNVAVHSASSTSVGRYGQFDVVLCVNVVVHPALHARNGVLRAANALLGPTGTLILVVPALESATMVAQAEQKSLTGRGKQRSGDWDVVSNADGVVTIEGMPYKHFTRRELRDSVAGLGLTVARIRRAEYTWSSQGVRPGPEVKGKSPWDWVVVATRR